MSQRIAALFTDGGLFLCNPSPWGGSWAYCQVDSSNMRIESGSGWGVVWPVQFPGWPITNNLTELAALIRGLEALPEGWSGTIGCDSYVTIQRVRDNASREGIPPAMQARLDHACRRIALAQVEWLELAGHPTRADLAQGWKVSGGYRLRVSEHNVWCDTQCRAVATRWKAKHPEVVTAYHDRRRRRRSLAEVAV